MEKLLSIVVPSYNTSKYIDECLPTFIDDCIDQIEILMVDDGSTDDTYEKAAKYAERYPNSIRVIKKENGGHGSVINTGINEAKGKYFKVIDGDDWIIKENLELFLNFLSTVNADVIINPFIQHLVGTGKERLVSYSVSSFNQEKSFDDVYKEAFTVAIHSVTYLTKLLKDNRVTFTEKCFYEDQQYDVFPMLYANTIAFYKEPLYVYRIGTTEQSINIENYKKNAWMSEMILDSLMDFVNQLPNNISPAKREYIIGDVCNRVNKRTNYYLKLPYGKAAKKELKEFFSHIKEKCPLIYNWPVGREVKLLRYDSWLFYTAVYVGYFFLRKKRGF